MWPQNVIQKNVPWWLNSIFSSNCYMCKFSGTYGYFTLWYFDQHNDRRWQIVIYYHMALVYFVQLMYANYAVMLRIK